MIIFDMDGTLWDTTLVTYEAANEIVSNYDELKPISMEQIIGGMGLNIEEVSKKYMPYIDLDKACKYELEIIKKNLEIIDEKGANIYDGVLDVIRKLSQKYKLGIITNNKDEYVESFFKTSNLKEYFADYIGTASYNITKADAIKIMVNRNNAMNNFYVGDIDKDMQAATEAGVGFIHARYGFGHDVDAKYYIDKFTDLEELLDGIIL